MCEKNEALKHVFTLQEAAFIGDVSVQMLRLACRRCGEHASAFSKDDCRKSGSLWLITDFALNRFCHKTPLAIGPWLNEVMTVSEAAEILGISPQKVRYACSGEGKNNFLFPYSECKRFKATWLVTKKGVLDAKNQFENSSARSIRK